MSNSSSGSRYSLTLKCATRYRRSAPFPYKFRSDDEVKHLWVEWRRKHSIYTGDNGHDNSDSEESIVSLCSASSGEITDTDFTTVYLTGLGGLPTNPAPLNHDSNKSSQHNKPECCKPIISQKRQYTSINPLCIVPSRKRSKLATSSKPPGEAAKTAKAKTVETMRTTLDASNKDSSEARSTYISDSAFHHTDTLIGYIPAAGDSNIISSVHLSMKGRPSPNWTFLDRNLKQPEGYSRNRYITVLLKYEMYDIAITRAVLSAQANNQPVPWDWLDEQHTLGHSKARWNQVLRLYCDNNGITFNGMLRPELFSRYRGDSAGTQSAENASGISTKTANITAPNVVTTAGTNRAQDFSSSSNNQSNVEFNAADTFSPEDDVQLLSAVVAARRNNVNSKISWLSIGRLLKRPVVILQSRYIQLMAQQKTRQRNKQQEQYNFDLVVDLNHRRINITDQHCNTSPTSTTVTNNNPAATNPTTNPYTAVDALVHNAQKGETTTATLKTANAPEPLACSNIAYSSALKDHTLPYTTAEDAIISERLPATCIYDRNFYTRLRRLANELRRTIYSVKLRWSELNKEVQVATASSVDTTVVECARAPAAFVVGKNGSRFFTTTSAENGGLTIESAKNATTIDRPTASAMYTAESITTMAAPSMSATNNDDVPNNSFNSSTSPPLTVYISQEALNTTVRICPVVEEARFQPFTAAEDALILERVPLSLHKTRELYLGFASLSKELNRPIDSLKYRWMWLYNTSRRASENAAAASAKDRRCVDSDVSVTQSTHTAQPSATTTDTTVSASLVPAFSTDAVSGYNAATNVLSEILPQGADTTYTIDIVNAEPTHDVFTHSIVPNDTIQPVNMSNSAESLYNVCPSLVSTEKFLVPVRWLCRRCKLKVALVWTEIVIALHKIVSLVRVLGRRIVIITGNFLFFFCCVYLCVQLVAQRSRAVAAATSIIILAACFSFQ